MNYYKFDYNATNKILRCRLYGHITDAILEEFYIAATECIAKVNPLSSLADLSDASSFDVPPGTVRDMARRTPGLPDTRRIRVVVAPTDHIFGMLRLFQLTGEHSRPNLHVVRTRREAWALLGVQEPRFEKLKIE